MKHILLASTLLLAACSQTETSADATEPAAQTTAQASLEKPSEPNITSQDLGGGFYMLLGPGGNIGVSTGDDGVYMIDDKFARFGQEIIDVVATLSDKPITYVLNTHHHGDHSGANVEMKAVGATVVAHDNVRTRMGLSYMNEAFGRQQDARAEALWPTLTFSQELTLWFNGDEVRAIHTPAGHTDGDTIVHFVGANIVHLGDNFFHNMLPFIDVDSGGTIQGMINAQQIAYDLSNDTTKVIPGHGPLSNKVELGASIKRLQAIHDRVKVRKDAGESLEAIVAADPLADMTELEGFMKKPDVIKATWRSLGGAI
ncbi:cyclase [Litorimonas cladophorae]|uniref:Cyclase n=1 Tax=Litorimonas cladophorae TaxID=1220491 RepID=A0A918KPT1_9PROT|nr:MBL fold metallo-hydrolase [Litorimonas cladophorae]GGX71225.1 cyclase [Litorimonas cladophorae]